MNSKLLPITSRNLRSDFSIELLPRRAKDEIALRKGDVVGVAGNHWNGLNKGKNKRTNRVGLYPEVKTKEKVKVVEFPTYPHVKL